MRLPITAAEIAPRIATGAFILNSGLGKRGADEATAGGIHGFAAGTYPFLQKVQPTTFAKAISTTEIVIGAALLTPFVPTVVAGVALTGFSAGLLGLYLRTPGMRKEGSIAPTQEGLTVSKDVWMLGIGAGLITQALTGRRPATPPSRTASKATGKVAHKASRKAGKKAAKADVAALRAAAKTGAAAGAAVTKVRDTVHV
jgi:uncharacterized membrane protein YphA (DoxX/SURF4 family)